MTDTDLTNARLRAVYEKQSGIDQKFNFEKYRDFGEKLSEQQLIDIILNIANGLQ